MLSADSQLTRACPLRGDLTELAEAQSKPLSRAREGGAVGQPPDADQKWLLARAVEVKTVVFTRVFSGKARAVNAAEKVI